MAKRDDTAYLEAILEELTSLRAENATLLSENNQLKTKLAPDTWHHSKTGIWQPLNSPGTNIPTSRCELLVRRLHSGVLMTKRPEVWDFLVRATNPTPDWALPIHGEDSSPSPAPAPALLPPPSISSFTPTPPTPLPESFIVHPE